MAQMRILLFQPPINPFQDSAKPTTTIINKIYVLLAFYSEWSHVAISGMRVWTLPQKGLGVDNTPVPWNEIHLGKIRWVRLTYKKEEN